MHPTLMLVRSEDVVETTPKTPQEKYQFIKGEIISGLEDRLEQLRTEALRTQKTMAGLVSKIDQDGFDANLEDLRSGKTYRLISEVKLLQEIRDLFDALEACK